jgi:hypothetical protein
MDSEWMLPSPLLYSLACELVQLELIPKDAAVVDLSQFPKVTSWLTSVSALPGWAKVHKPLYEYISSQQKAKL